ncbi:MAG: hypothetical protein ACEQSF_01315 [Solirubrobacteraceae bacterium]
MKKPIQIFVALVVASGFIFTACKTPTKKVENAAEKVIEAKDDLYKQNKEFLLEVEEYKKSTIDKIIANEKNIEDFNLRIATQKINAKEDYEKKIAKLNAKNLDLKKKINDFKSDNKENWEIFKSDFSREMDKLNLEFQSFTSKK